MIIAKWEKGYGSLFGKADAQKVAEEILSIGESATPAQILDKARNRKTELHKCFTWDDTEAAEKWRLQEARQIVVHLVIDKPSDPQMNELRVFHRVGNTYDSGYKPLDVIIASPDDYNALLSKAKAELISFRNKYNRLNELELVFDAIEKVI